MSEYIKIDDLSLAVLDACDYYGEGQIITRINVPRRHRQKGYGSALLKRAMDKATLGGYALYLEILSSDGLNREQLEAWYLRHGFKHIGGGMYRRDP